MEVGIRELRLHFSAYLARVRQGERIVVTDRGRPVARLDPPPFANLTPHLQHLIDTGRATYNPNAPRFVPAPVPMEPGGKTLADYVSEQRR